MASKKQIAANRANAKKSTGPRTAEGCARSSRNAYRHGLSLPMTLDSEAQMAVDALARAIAGKPQVRSSCGPHALWPKHSSSSKESAGPGLPPYRPSWIECSIPGR
jgi:hypothetical protein